MPVKFRKTRANPVPRMMLTMLSAACALIVPHMADAQTLDCPLRQAPYSIDSPLMDILLKPDARAAVEREAPTLLRGMPSGASATTAPSITAIMTLRVLAGFKRLPDADLSRVDRALGGLRASPTDQRARCARYDVDDPELAISTGHPRILLFEKMTGFRDGPSVDAARTAFRAMAARRGWALVVTDRAGAMTPAILKNFDAVIWNNVSGDVLTFAQRRAFTAYIERGGGYVGIHGSGGDFIYYWPWYVDRLLGAQFIGHPMSPQFQNAQIRIEATKSGIGRDLGPGWTMTDEWYSFRASPRLKGANVIARLDEASYAPKGMGAQDLHMGDHPIAWTRCVGSGRAFYSAIGHRPEGYAEPHHVRLLEEAVAWASGEGATRCRNDREIGRETRP